MWQSPSELFEHQPTVRLDYNLTDNHRLNGSLSQITAKRTPDYLNNADPRFPGAPNQRDFVSTRPLLSTALRSVMSKNTHQRAARRADRLRQRLELRLSLEHRVAQRSDHVRRLERLRDHHADQHDRLVHVERPELAQGADLQHRRHADLEAERAHDHGGRQPAHLERVGVRPADRSAGSRSASTPTSIRRPACSTPPTSRAPRARSCTAARRTYAVLTGRVASVTSQAVLDGSTGKYVELAPSTLEGGIKVFGMFAQDSWRLRPNLTLTGGLRYDVQTPFKPSSNVMSAVTMDEHLRPVGRRRRRPLQPVQLPRSRARRAAARRSTSCSRKGRRATRPT